MKSPDPSHPGIQAGLPLKITGIVFWGLMAIGPIVATGAIKWLEQEILARYQSRAAQAVSSIQAILDINVGAAPEPLRT